MRSFLTLALALLAFTFSSSPAQSQAPRGVVQRTAPNLVVRRSVRAEANRIALRALGQVAEDGRYRARVAEAQRLLLPLAHRSGLLERASIGWRVWRLKGQARWIADQRWDAREQRNWVTNLTRLVREGDLQEALTLVEALEVSGSAARRVLRGRSPTSDRLVVLSEWHTEIQKLRDEAQEAGSGVSADGVDLVLHSLVELARQWETGFDWARPGPNGDVGEALERDVAAHTRLGLRQPAGE